MKRQSGYIYPRAGWWVTLLPDSVIENGKLVRKQLAHKLERIADTDKWLKRPPTEIEKIAEKFLRPVNDGETKPEATQTIAAFGDAVFLPLVQQRVRQSTYRGYVARWESQLRDSPCVESVRCVPEAKGGTHRG